MAKYNIIVEQDEDGWYVSEVVELAGCHTQARSVEELIERTREAILAYLETEKDSDSSQKFIEIKQIEV